MSSTLAALFSGGKRCLFYYSGEVLSLVGVCCSILARFSGKCLGGGLFYNSLGLSFLLCCVSSFSIDSCLRVLLRLCTTFRSSAEGSFGADAHAVVVDLSPVGATKMSPPILANISLSLSLKLCARSRLAASVETFSFLIGLPTITSFDDSRRSAAAAFECYYATSFSFLALLTSRVCCSLRSLREISGM